MNLKYHNSKKLNKFSFCTDRYFQFITLLVITSILLISAKDNSYSKNFVSTAKTIEQIEQTLLFSDLEDIKTKEQKDSALIIDKEYENQYGESELQIVVVNPEDNYEIRKKTKMAYSASLVGQYEVAIELYKQVLKLEPDNNYIKFALATSYHNLKQYKQAKDIYYNLLKTNPDNKSDIIGNLLDIIIEESPTDALYFLNRLKAQNPKSADILARAAIVYNKTNKKDQAIILLSKAISLNPDNTDYKLNLAIIYDQTEDYKKALPLYKDVIKNYSKDAKIQQPESIISIKKRVEFIKNINNNSDFN